MAVQQKIRQVKLQPKHRSLNRSSKDVPWLNVSGVWLEELGFKVGDIVRISTRERLLIIEPAEPAELEARRCKAAFHALHHHLKELTHGDR